jgi:hypothetical protein
MDCFVVPSNETNGELVHFDPNLILDFRDKIEPGFFWALDDLLARIVPEADVPKADLRMVIGRLRDETRACFYFAAPDKYPTTAPEAEVWTLVDTVFMRRLMERFEKE